ncbi:MAG: hypothetical protein ABFE02_06440 [Sulfuricella sp.]
MYYTPRIFSRITLLAAFLFTMYAGSEQALAVAAGENNVQALSAEAAERQADVPNIQPMPAAVKAEAESNGTLWLLLGGAGLGLAFFWLGRRSGTPSEPLVDMPRRVVPVQQDSGAVSSDAVKYWIPLDQDTTVTVDELSSVEEEAEVFLLLGRMDMAIGVLRHHVEANEAAPAHVWMSLLDVLHAQGLRQEFEKLAAEIRGRFNVALPTWEGANARSNELTGLEHFPHLFAKVTAQWNSADYLDCLDYLHSLTQDNRNGERGGLNLEAFRELLMLIGVLEIKQKMAVTQPMAA